MPHLEDAHKQWSTRPPEERYPNLETMKIDALSDRDFSVEQHYHNAQHISVQDHGDSLRLHNSKAEDGDGLDLNNWSFRQLCSLTSSPAAYLATLPTELAANNLNYTLNAAADDRDLMLLTKDKGLRAITSQKYSRLYDYEIIQRIEGLQEDGWTVPPAYPVTFEDDHGTITTSEDSGLYRGDRSMFAFMVNEKNRIDDGSDGGLGRGFFVQNSEVGASSFRLTTFLYRYVCGNHIVWDAQNITDIRMRHVGKDLDIRCFHMLGEDLVDYANESASATEEKIRQAKECILGKSKKEVLDFLFGKRLLTRKAANQAYDSCAVVEPDLNPTSVWGMVQGVTQIAQNEVHASDRVELESVSAKLMELV